jgi:hypothetical protein
MMTDLVTRLRSLTIGYAMEGSWRTILAEAADEIERLRMECGNLATVETVREVNAENRELKAEIKRLRAKIDGFVSGSAVITKEKKQ